MSAPSNNDSELSELLSDLIDDNLTEERRHRLGEMVQRDPSARAQYLEHCRMHAMLEWEHGVLSASSFPVEEETLGRCSRLRTQRYFKPLGIAAAIALTTVLFWQLAAPSLRRQAWLSGAQLGSIANSAGGTLDVENTTISLATGDSLRAGDYELHRGAVDLRFSNNVSVLIEAPARFRVESQQQLVLHAGRLSANVPAEGIGFTVQTPEAMVIDYGTEFGVEVTAGLGSEIHVFEGEVEVESRMLESDTLRLFTNQATRVDEIEGSQAGITIAPDRFLRSLTEPQRSYAETILALEPALYFRMPPSHDGLTLIDLSENKRNGQIVAANREGPRFRPGRVGSALSLGGSRDRAHVVVPDYPKATNDRLTVSGWVRAESRPRWASIAKNWGEGKIGQFHFGLLDHSGELEVRILQKNGKGVLVNEAEPFPIGTWQHVVFVADGTVLRLYRNGQEVGSAPYQNLVTPTFAPLGIGAKLVGNHENRPGTPSDFWHGRIDELAVFNHALDAQVIKRLYEAAKTN